MVMTGNDKKILKKPTKGRPPYESRGNRIDKTLHHTGGEGYLGKGSQKSTRELKS